MTKINLKPFVRAYIKDIQKQNCEIVTDKMLVDTNVLYFCYYDRWSQLDNIRRGAQNYQLREYSKFFKKLLNSKVTLFVHRISLYEFAHRIEMAELMILYCQKNNIANLDGIDFPLKDIRRDYHSENSKIKNNLIIYLHAIQKTFNLLNFDRKLDLFLFDFLSDWKDSISGAADAMMVSEAKQSGINSILSDDSDFVSFENIELYTANYIAINCQ